jgi:hypothetical protein
MIWVRMGLGWMCVGHVVLVGYSSMILDVGGLLLVGVGR